MFQNLCWLFILTVQNIFCEKIVWLLLKTKPVRFVQTLSTKLTAGQWCSRAVITSAWLASFALRQAAVTKCPKCRGDWAELEVRAVPGMAVGAEAQVGEQVDLIRILKKGDGQCRFHELSYDFWKNKNKEFYCKKCIIELGITTSDLQLIDDAVPMIKSDIGDKFAETNEQLEEDLKTIDDFQLDFSEKLKHVSEYREKIQKLEKKLQKFLITANALRSKRHCDSAIAKKAHDEREKIKSEADIARMVSSRVTLKSLKQPCCLPVLQGPESLLCSIACAYMESDDEFPSSTAFISELMQATGISAKPLTKAVLDADQLKEDEEWVVDQSNCLGALLALADKQPGHLQLLTRHDDPEPLAPADAAAVITAVRGCNVWLELYHSFLRPQEHKEHNTDRELLDHLLNNGSLRLTSFYGRLGAADIAQLPPTVTDLGLAIGSRDDATAVSGLQQEQFLDTLNVSVSSEVAACDLSQLPRVKSISLYFPGLTDARVDSVRPAIEALVPDLKFQFLGLPLSQLTAEGTCRLVQLLRGAEIADITFEPSGPWRPGKAEKERVDKELHDAVGCSNTNWDMEWEYE